MRRVVIETPYAGGLIARWLNRRYLRRCIRHSIMLGEAPFASHALYHGALNDRDPGERAMGISCGFVWGWLADVTVVYVDRGISRGMRLGITSAEHSGRPVIFRTLDKKRAPEGALVGQDLERFSRLVESAD